MKTNVKRHVVVQPLDPSIRLIPLTRGQAAIVDATLYKELSCYNWCAIKCQGKFYAGRHKPDGGGSVLLMHRQIMGFPRGKLVDHENGNTLDNRQDNLRKATKPQNHWNTGLRKDNTSGFIGISWAKHANAWLVKIRVSPKSMYLGYRKTAEEAAKLYDEAARKYHGEFARTNFPLDKDTVFR